MKTSNFELETLNRNVRTRNPKPETRNLQAARFSLAILTILCLTAKGEAQGPAPAPNPFFAPDLLRIHIIQPGLYRITGAELSQFRPDIATLDPARLVLKHYGRPCPMLIDRLDGQGRITSDTRAIFFADLDLPVPFVNVFADNAPITNFYQLFFEGDPSLPSTAVQDKPLRFASAAPSQAVGPPLEVVDETLHLEMNSIWEFFQPAGETESLVPTDFRFWVKLARPATTENEPSYTFAFEMPDLSEGVRPGKIEAFLYGLSNLKGVKDHNARLLFNGVEVARASWDGMRPQTLAGDIPTSAMTRGKNTVKVELIEPQPGPGPAEALAPVVAPVPAFDVAVLDWVEVTYPRRPVATKDYVRFSLTGQGPQRVSIGGFTTTNLTAFDIGRARTLGVDVKDTGGSKTATVVVDAPTSVVVLYGDDTPLGKPFGVEPVRLARLRRQKTEADCLIVAPEEFLPALTPLIEWRRAEGLKVAAVAADAIYQEFAGGFPGPQAIKDFVAFARKAWGRPRYLILVGDACAVSAIKTWLPTHSFNTEGGSHASDQWFATFGDDGTTPSLAVGRLSATSPEQVAAIVKKTIDRERNLKPGPWRSEALLIAASSNWAIRDSRYIMRRQLSPLVRGSLLQTNRDARDLAEHARLTRQIVDAMNEGRAYTIFFGHGGGTVWEVGPSIRQDFFRVHLFDSSNVRALTNVDRQTIVLALTCFTNDFDHPHFPETIGESFLRAPGGAVAVLGTSGRTDDAISARFAREFFRQAIDLRRERIGDAMREALGVTSNTLLSRHLVLLGDPCARLMLPGGIDMTTGTKTGNPGLSVSGKLEGGDFTGQGLLTVIDTGGALISSSTIEIENGQFETRVTLPQPPSVKPAATPPGAPAGQIVWPLAVRVYAADPRSGRDWLGAVRVD